MKILIVGLGSIGARHLKNFNRILPSAKLYALRSNKASIETELKNYDDKLMPSYVRLSKLQEVEELSPDYVVICTPSFLHAENIQYFHSKTNAVILVEKPCAINMEQLERLSFLADSKRIFVVQQMRFHPISDYLKNIVAKKILGNCYRFRLMHSEHVGLWHPWENYKNSYVVSSGMGGGSFLTQNHELDLSIYLFGMPDRQISLIGRGDHLGIDCDEMSSILMHFYSTGPQIIGEVGLDLLGQDPRKIGEFHFEGGSIYVDFINNTVDLKSNKNPVSNEMKYIDLKFERNLPYLRMLDTLVNQRDFVTDPRIVPMRKSLEILRNTFSSVVY
jgi:predicted dehydrogenase